MTIAPERKRQLVGPDFDYENEIRRVTFLPPEGRSLRPTKRMVVDLPDWLHEEVVWLSETLGLTPEGLIMWTVMNNIACSDDEEET